MHEALRPWTPTRSDPWDFDAAAHLWRRAGFGAPVAEIEATLRLDPAAAAARAVRGPAEDAATAELESIYRTVVGTSNADNVRAWLLTRMARCGHQLREKQALFWHGHFATSILKVRDPVWMARQYRIFLDHALGPFETLLLAVTRDPAMIRWLDNESNAKGRPNENYARELFELFTLGEGNYTEKDIREAARAFTGWHILSDRFHFSKSLHDEGEKTVLGERGKFDGDDVCRIALKQEACGRFLADKLLRFYVHPAPRPEIVSAFGAELRGRGYDLAAALDLLFASRLFYAPESRRALVKSPVEYVVGGTRALEAPLDASQAVDVLRAMGQDLLAPPNVKGWPGHLRWVNTATWLTRVNAARGFLDGFEPRLGGAAALDHYGRALLGRPLDGPEREKLLQGGAGKKDLAHALLALPEAHVS